MRPVPRWQERRARDKARLAEIAEESKRGPLDYDQVRQAARAEDERVRAQLRGYLERYPDSPNAPLWRGTLERGHWTVEDLREAVALAAGAAAWSEKPGTPGGDALLGGSIPSGASRQQELFA